MACVGNISNPPRLSLIGEIFLMGGLVRYSLFSLLPIIFIFFFRSCYTLYLFSYVFHGRNYTSEIRLSRLENKELIIMAFHLLPLNIIFLAI